MRAVLFTEFGGADKLFLGEAPIPQIDSINTMLVRVKATALNRADILQRKGGYPPPSGSSEILGLEMAGIVEKISPEAEKDGWKVGEKVFALLPGGGYAQYCVIPHGMAVRMPENISFEEAAAIPEAFMTAWQALIWLGGLNEKTERVLIHAGASGVGTAAICLCREYAPKAQILITAGSQDKIDFCKQLGASAGFNYKEGPWLQSVMSATEGKGVNIVLDFVGASYWEQNLNCLSVEGNMIVLAFLGGSHAPAVDISPILRKRLTIKGSTLRARSIDYKIRLTKDLSAWLVPKLTDGSIKPVIARVFPLDQVKESHIYMENNQNAGKLVLTIP